LSKNVKKPQAAGGGGLTHTVAVNSELWFSQTRAWIDSRRSGIENCAM